MGEQFGVRLGDELVPVTVRRNAQAKRLILRIDQSTGEIKLTLPKYVGNRAAEKFLQKQIAWIEAERAVHTPARTLGHESMMPYHGAPHQIVFTDVAPRRVARTQGKITIGGPADLAPKRLENWLRREAKTILNERAADHAGTLGVRYNRVSIGDMKSRWGSCSSRGTLRFSWRLLMAPYAVMDYVAAHEVAHLLEMNHSDRFWAHVARCVPDHKERRRWLKTEGNALFQLQF